jgi:hypothetical protein
VQLGEVGFSKGGRYVHRRLLVSWAVGDTVLGQPIE